MNVSDQEGEEYQTIDEYQRENRILKSKIDNYKENLNIFDDLISMFKNEICELKKEKEIQSEKCNLLNTQNSQYQNEIIVLKSEITQFKSKSDLAISEQIDKQLDTAKQLNEWKNKTNELEMQIVKLKSENEKAVLYLNDYIKNFKQFEEHLKTVLNEKKKINEQKMQLESELNNLKKQQFKQSDSNDNCTVSVQTSNPDETETEKLKRENSELVSKCANLRINFSRLAHAQKEQKEKKNLLLDKLKENSEEITRLNLKIEELEDKLLKKDLKNNTKRKNDEITPNVPNNLPKIIKLMDLKLE